jgi:hypothetical protein
METSSQTKTCVSLINRASSDPAEIGQQLSAFKLVQGAFTVELNVCPSLKRVAAMPVDAVASPIDGSS